MFVHAPKLTEVPPDLPPGPYREAVELANEATFTAAEIEAYQRTIDEINQARELMELAATAEARGWTKGETAGLAKGIAEGEAEAILAVLTARGIPLDSTTRARIVECSDETTLDLWIARAATAGSAEDVVAPAS